MICGWYEIINGTSLYYQSCFNLSKISAQLSDYKEILKYHMQEKSITGTSISYISSSMRVTAKARKPEESRAMRNKSE